LNSKAIIQELQFKAVRCSGAGGQHVNKVASKIELFFDVTNSSAISDDEKTLILKNLKSKLTKDNVLILSCDESRSQHKNKELVIEKFLTLIVNSLKIPKKRKATKPTKSSIDKRIEKKKNLALKKALRKKPLL
jgi:ribosome-associated protein